MGNETRNHELERPASPRAQLRPLCSRQVVGAWEIHELLPQATLCQNQFRVRLRQYQSLRRKYTVRFEEFAAGLKGTLKAQYLRSGGFLAPTDMGTARELFCKDFLSQFLPENIAITSGELIDSYGHQAGQTDIVLYDKEFFSYRIAPGLELLIVEGCLAAVEVKSRLDKATFVDCLSKCRAIKNLKLSLRQDLPVTHKLQPFTFSCVQFDRRSENTIKDWESEVATYVHPKFYIFSYTGPSKIETLRGWLHEYVRGNHDPSKPTNEIYEELPDFICILDSGVVYMDNGFAFMIDPVIDKRLPTTGIDSIYQFIQTARGEVAAFAFHVLQSINIKKREQRLGAMGMSIHLRRYFDLAVNIKEDPRK